MEQKFLVTTSLGLVLVLDMEGTITQYESLSKLTDPDVSYVTFDAQEMLVPLLMAGDTFTGKISFDVVTVQRMLQLPVSPYAPLEQTLTIVSQEYNNLILHPRFPSLTKILPLEMEFLNTFIQASARGIAVDVPQAVSIQTDLLLEHETYQAELNAIAGRPVKAFSPKDVAQLLYGDLGFQPTTFSKTGKPSVSEEALEDYKHHPAVINLLGAKKARSKYSSIDTILDSLVNHRAHAKVLHVGEDGTSRVYYTEPSLSQVPYELRHAFKADPGKKMVFWDLSSAEFIACAYMAKCTELTDLYEKGEDLHAYVAAKILGRPIQNNDEREVSKVVVFATIYGSEGAAVARALKISQAEGEALVRKFLKSFPEIDNFRKKMIAFAQKKGYTLTYYKRPRLLPGITEANHHVGLDRQAFNTCIQGTVADCIKDAATRIKNYSNIGAEYILSVFDSILLQVDEDASDEDIHTMIEEVSLNNGIKFRYKWATGSSWGEAQEKC